MSDQSSSTNQDTPSRRRRINRVRDWLVPKSVVGLVALVLSFSIGASLSGVGFYAFYQYQQTQTTEKVDNYIKGFDERFRTASDTIDNQKQNAQSTIQQELSPLLQFAKEGNTLGTLANQVKDGVWFVQTQDASGAPSVGSAFVVQSNDTTSLLVTSYATVKAATAAPGPGITISKGDDRINAKLVNWVENQDLAVISVDRGKLPALQFVPDGSAPGVGDRTFVASGLGAAGASASQGFINDISVGAIQQDAPVGVAYQGGPLLNSEGQVIGVASLNYAPFGFVSRDGITFAIPIRDTCKQLLTCPADANSVQGAKAR